MQVAILKLSSHPLDTLLSSNQSPVPCIPEPCLGRKGNDWEGVINIIQFLLSYYSYYSSSLSPPHKKVIITALLLFIKFINVNSNTTLMPNLILIQPLLAYFWSPSSSTAFFPPFPASLASSCPLFFLLPFPFRSLPKYIPTTPSNHPRPTSTSQTLHSRHSFRATSHSFLVSLSTLVSDHSVCHPLLHPLCYQPPPSTIVHSKYVSDLTVLLPSITSLHFTSFPFIAPHPLGAAVGQPHCSRRGLGSHLLPLNHSVEYTSSHSDPLNFNSPPHML